MSEEKIKEVFSDEAFVKSLMELETPEEVQKALAEKGIDLSIDEINAAAKLFQKKVNGELKDEELQDVAGGSFTFAVVATLAVVGSVTAADITYRAVRHRW